MTDFKDQQPAPNPNPEEQRQVFHNTTTREASLPLQQQFQAFVESAEPERKFGPKVKERKFRLDPPHLLLVDYRKVVPDSKENRTSNEDVVPHEEVIRKYFSQNAGPESRKFADTASITLVKSEGEDTYRLVYVIKGREHGHYNSRIISIKDTDNSVRFSIRSGEMPITINFKQGELLNFDHSLQRGDDYGRWKPKPLPSLAEIKKGPVIYESEDLLPHLTFEYDEGSQSVIVTSRVVSFGTSSPSYKGRAIKIPVLVDTEQVRKRLTNGPYESLDLKDPYNANADSDIPWLEADLEKIVGIEDLTPMGQAYLR